MRAIMPTALPEVIAHRKKTGADRWDEMWEGVLHLPPSPNRRHQDIVAHTETFLRGHWVPRSGGKVFHQINVAAPGEWPDNYRIPDLVLLLPDRFDIDMNEYFDGGPNVAVEIHSPGDEAYDKLDFYFDVGVQEVWIIDRNSLEVEIYIRENGEPKTLAPDADGWLTSPATDVQFRIHGEELMLRVAGDDATLTTLP